ncbi:hypothetical protein NMG29_39920 [Streptomyces cocklensis]|uniref:Uncharacterized protein n=1 Tax=Actinacidiphila cocklensis TaxID=887465 RepID=A0A9W4GNY4_9ACTN|nr:hypothetical protein [Actinacidiphila cocklensis]MDD1064231.1 hypothetical protein [Actinacidiphila cocklensis]CAG6391813.1 hypothetical protein SCOCK_140011 [Actinacidiphila cocklensis]
MEDDAKADRLTAVIEAKKNADIAYMKAETEQRKDLLRSQTEQINSRFQNKMTWGVGGAVVLVAALWAFGVPRAIKGMHLPVSPGVAKAAGTAGLAAIAWVATAVWRKIRARIVRRAVSDAMRRDDPVRTETVSPLPGGRQTQLPPGQQGGQSQADVS